MRSEFEKLPEIKDSLSENIVFIGNKYTTSIEGFFDLVNWLNGAWYAFQHQQSKVDELQKRLDKLEKSLMNNISDLEKCYQDDKDNKFEYWRGFADCANTSAKKLEQALNGGEA